MLTTAPILDDPQELRRDAEPEPEAPERSDEERRAWYREGIESLREYRRTGMHLTWEEVEAWMDKWGNEEFTEPPECHT